ncbi:MAG: rRNA maturation RNase YbeY [Oscillospiraceae bacterium]
MANKVLISNRQNAVKIPSGTRLLIRRCCNAVLKNENFKFPAEISVSFVDNTEIKKINSEYRAKDVETDVLSFPLFNKDEFKLDEGQSSVMIGDVVISIEKAVEQANLFGHSLQREIAFLTVHSMLHLLGYHHEEGGLQEVHMREREELILKQLGLPRGLSYVTDSEE